MLNSLDLFSGYGGIAIALKDYARPILYCEIEEYAQRILLSRIKDELLPFAPIWPDVRRLDGNPFRGLVDILTAGFPCQDISAAGKGKGLAGERSGLFYEIIRLTEEIKPPFIFLENVPAIKLRGLPEVAREFTSRGYDIKWLNLSASEAGARHKRNRWFLLAYSKGYGNKRDGREFFTEKAKPESEGPWAIFNSSGKNEIFRGDYWKTEPAMARMVNGIAYQLDRNKAIGNGVCPKQAKEAFEELMRA